jgi:hypothetical protein
MEVYMKIRVTFVSNDIEGNAIGEIHDKELSENVSKLLIRFLGDNSKIYGKDIRSWEVWEDHLRLCVERDDKGIDSYLCEVDAEFLIKLSVVGKQSLEGDDWSMKLLRGIMESRHKDT